MTLPGRGELGETQSWAAESAVRAGARVSVGWGNGAGSAEELGDLGRGWERKPGWASALRGGGGGARSGSPCNY